MKVVSLVGARPQFVKEALVGAEMRARGWEHALIHSGQHYDPNMSDIFFSELGVAAPKYRLNMGPGRDAAAAATAIETARAGIEEALIREKPAALILYGDTDTTLAGARAAAGLGIPIVHVEAGVRQEPASMPEESNRRRIDHAAAATGGLLCCCSQGAADNLAGEGIRSGVHVTGDVMYDLFVRMRGRFDAAAACGKWGVKPREFILLTLHRDFNVDQREALWSILCGMERLRRECGLRILFPVHPRTRKRLAEFGLEESPLLADRIPPLGYFDTLSLASASAFVVTDSGGLQKEAFYAGRRAVVVMPDTGWRELADSGWNLLAPAGAEAVFSAGIQAMRPAAHPGAPYGRGDAAARIVRLAGEAFA